MSTNKTKTKSVRIADIKVEAEKIEGVSTERLDMLISELVENNKNPRVIKKENFARLKKSIQDFPEMMKLRPIVVDENNVVLGGNMRFKASLELGIETVSVIKVKGLSEEQKKEFVVKDNKSFGDWDWEMLSSDWNVQDLNDWGFGDWKPKQVDIEKDGVFEKAFEESKNEDAYFPVIPKFDEKHEMIIIVSESEVDSNWLRERLGLQKMKSYKTGELMKSSVINVKDLYDVL